MEFQILWCGHKSIANPTLEARDVPSKVTAGVHDTK
jgi:hypothetical protein